ncbi:ATP-binding cassette domain-containing protein [uncultured Chitinophaga sp.]|jgi:ABC-type multidrug transport system, ATPase component|uniref:ATP-binding cassette domain-containing protein n=1 Tax=uncultured Chitinophaga sp. TaxID=339340 RepID=UPI0026225BC8|nr:ATP-binding cassette domain-containing protein [uncultured Chitinophaga sp.]
MKHQLEADSIQKNYGTKELLTDVYLKCETGDIIGLLGRNGSGKSTLLKILFGTEPALNSSIRINGKPCPFPYRQGGQIAYLPQHRFLPADIPVRKIIGIFIADKHAQQSIRANERISPHLNKYVNELSGGELRYLEIMLLLNLDVKFVLMDEPFSGMEPLYKERIAALITAYRTTKGFIITDHDYRNIIGTSTQLLLLSNGVCKRIQSLDQLETQHYLPPGTLAEFY